MLCCAAARTRTRRSRKPGTAGRRNRRVWLSLESTESQLSWDPSSLKEVRIQNKKRSQETLRRSSPETQQARWKVGQWEWRPTRGDADSSLGALGAAHPCPCPQAPQACRAESGHGAGAVRQPAVTPTAGPLGDRVQHGAETPAEPPSSFEAALQLRTLLEVARASNDGCPAAALCTDGQHSHR